MATEQGESIHFWQTAPLAGKEHRAVTLAKELLQAQLSAPPSLEELAAAVNLSPFHFARVFRRATGMPPHTWLMQQRIARARTLLQGGCLPLEVATQLGFADQIPSSVARISRCSLFGLRTRSPARRSSSRRVGWRLRLLSSAS